MGIKSERSELKDLHVAWRRKAMVRCCGWQWQWRCQLAMGV
jgi:hypothetical protein